MHQTVGIAVPRLPHVSTSEQNLDAQLDALRGAGAGRTFADKIGGSLRKRLELERLFDQLCEGDVVVVAKYDRLARSLKDLIEIVDAVRERGAGFRSLAEEIDTTTPAGRLTFHVFASIAQFERERISERTREGLEAARRRGRVGGGRRRSRPRRRRGRGACATRNDGPCPRSRRSSGSAPRRCGARDERC